MIAVILRDFRWRILVLFGMSIIMFALEPGFHQHDDFTLEAVALGPLGVSSTMSYFAGLTMIILLSGFVSTDRREGYSRLYLANPVSPLALYGLKWAVAYTLAILGSLLFLVIGQVIAWGAFYGGFRGMILPALSALVYGGLIAFFSVLLRRGDGWVLAFLFLPTFFPEIITLGLSPLPPGVRQLAMFLLPPHSAFQEIWSALILEESAWTGIVFAATYGAVFLLAAGIILRLREWP